MELDDLLNALDRSAANLAKLEAVWERAAPFIPHGPARGSHPEYDDLSRTWNDLLVGLPKIDGWTITDALPDIDEVGAALIDYMEIGEPAFSVWEASEQPERDLAEYRFRLNRARRRAARQRLQELVALVEATLARLLSAAARDSQDRLEGLEVEVLSNAIGEIERLVGDTAERRGRWSDLHRHMYFGQGHDWQDVRDFDWPSVKADIEAAAFSDADPLPVPDMDLGEAASGRLTGRATIALPWERLTDDGLERLLYDLFRDLPDYQNVQWLMHTNAPDRGRDLSVERVLRGSTGAVRTERVIVQAKHWLKKSVAPADVSATLTAVKLWEPPVVRGLIVATTGRFTADAVAWAEQHNDRGGVPFIDLWPESTLETLLAQKPHLAAAHGLR